MKTKRTDIVRKTCDPAFNESFTFKLSPNNLDAASVSVVAMQYSIGHRGQYLQTLSSDSSSVHTLVVMQYVVEVIHSNLVAIA